MSREEYIKVLSNKLKRLPKDDREKALEYFVEYFEDAGEENEQQAIENLGDPKQAADQIICELAVKNSREGYKEKSVKKGMKGVWIGILAAFATPIALPMILAVVVLILALIIAVSSTLLALLIAGASMVLSSAVVFISGIVMISKSIAVTLICIGMTGLLIGVGVILVVSSYLLFRAFIGGIIKIFGNIAGKGMKKNEEK